MNNANELCDKIVRMLQDEYGMDVAIVNNQYSKVTEDSVVEHVADLDVEYEGWAWGVSIYVNRIGEL